MKIVADKTKLLAALTVVASVAMRKSPIDVLTCVLIDAKGEGIVVTGTDMDRRATCPVACRVEAPGVVAVSADQQADSVGALPDGCDIEMQSDSDSGAVTVRAGRSRYVLAGRNPDDFPTWAPDAFIASFDMAARDFERALATAAIAMSNEQSRYYLRGVYLVRPPEDDRLYAVATNGYILAEVDMPAPDGSQDMGGVIVPDSTVHLLRKMAGKHSGDVTIQVCDTAIRVQIGGVEILSKIIDGTFPDYGRIIPAGDMGNRLTVRSDEMTRVLGAVSVMLDGDEESSIKITCAADETVVSNARQLDGGQVAEVAMTDGTWTWTGAAEMRIGFNANYLRQIMAVAEDGEVDISISSPAEATLVSGPALGRARYVVMPMRVN
jgi:DNA polymerase-3 subunit beta